MSSKVRERRLEWFGHLRRLPLQHANRKIMDMKPPRRQRGRPRTRWAHAMDRDMIMVGLERKMADDRRRLRPMRRPQMTGGDDGRAGRDEEGESTKRQHKRHFLRRYNRLSMAFICDSCVKPTCSSPAAIKRSTDLMKPL